MESTMLKHTQKKKAVLDASLEGAQQQWVKSGGKAQES